MRRFANRRRAVSRAGKTTPGTRHVPWVHIHRSGKTPEQSAAACQRRWILEFIPTPLQRAERLGPFVPLRFNSCGAAVRFAQRHGWTYVVEDTAEAPIREPDSQVVIRLRQCR